MGAKRKKGKADPSAACEGGGFEMTSMIDVTFLLIIFFMCVTELADQSKAKVELPVAEKAEEDTHIPGRVIINITEKGERMIMGQEYDDAGLSRLMQLEREASVKPGDQFPSRAILIRVDKNTEYEDVEHVMQLCMENKLWRIAFATKDPNAPEKRR
jgi:biopolymer transport protein ExbD